MPTPESKLAAEIERYDQQIRELESLGFHEIEDDPRYEPFARVHHVGEQYHTARTMGTANVLAVMERTVGGRRDVELIVHRDKPILPGMSTVTSWADYHTIVVTP